MVDHKCEDCKPAVRYHQHNHTLPLEFKTLRITDMQRAKTKRKARIAWSKDEVKLLKRLYQGDNAQSIADELGRSYRAVTVKAHKLGLTKELRVKLGLRKRLRYHEGHRVVDGTKEKLCGECERWKAESQFCISRRTKDGLRWRCKECESKYTRKRRERIRKAGRRNLRYEERHRVLKGAKQKFCRKCKRWKNETGFGKNRSTRDGLVGRCKKCSCKPTGKSCKKRLGMKN